MNIVLASRRKYMRKRTNPEGAPASVEDCIVSLVRDSFPYTGQPITPQVSVVTQDGVPLVVNLDYFVSYSDNVNVGAGVVIVTGTGEYVGSVTKTFQITSAAPSTDWDFDLSKTELVAKTNLSHGFDDSSSRRLSFVEHNNAIYYITQHVNHNIVLGEGMSIDGIVESGSQKRMYQYETFCGFDKTGGLAIVIHSDTGNSRLRTRDVAVQFEIDSINNEYVSSANFNTLNEGRVEFSKDGLHVFLVDHTGSFTVGTASQSGLVRFDLATPFDITTAVKSQFLDVALVDGIGTPGESVTFNNAFVSPNGGRVIVVLNRKIVILGLETPFNIESGINTIGSIDTYDAFSIGGLRNMFINEDGTKAIIVNNKSVIAELSLRK